MVKIFCSGMMRSGSTLAFNVLRTLLEMKAAVEGTTIRTAFANTDDIDALLHDKECGLVKTHTTSAATIEAVRAGMPNVVTVRDPRDIYLSRRKFVPDEDEAITEGWIDHGILCCKAYSGTNSLFVAYEDIIGQPEKVVKGIAQYIGLKISDAQASAIAESLSRNNVKKYVEDVADIDPVTFFHGNHITNSQGWKDSPKAEYLTERFAEGIKLLGYQ